MKYGRVVGGSFASGDGWDYEANSKKEESGEEGKYWYVFDDWAIAVMSFRLPSGFQEHFSGVSLIFIHSSCIAVPISITPFL